ncbi:uncharacterized protein LOC112468833, partial [Temnothorax curvispinosus]|uniref:Uncharacterized protein LOC112468833 n=1 Tax=Temnothorax curvispinosus TaxID=300111 RepID=A0A6J1RMP2_9HYME
MPYVQATLKLNVTATHLRTDSVVTLTWIKSHASRWKDFVRNRVFQLQELTANAHWKYVPGTSNPADCSSRGLTTAQLQSHSLWWTGPPWILTPEAWPSQPALPDELNGHEARPGIALYAAASQPNYHWDLILKFIALLRGSWDGSLDSHSALEKARFFWIKATQAAYFTYEIKMLTANSRLPTAHASSRLTAYIDAQGLIRVGGRLNQPALDQDNKHQAMLPRHFSTLIIAHAHLRTRTGGTQLTLAHVRHNYWIIGGRAPAQWSAHYLQRQQAISKWHHPNNNIKMGSIVLLTDERSPPCKWPLTKETALHPSKGGLTRVVTLKTATTTLTRPSAKLAILPISTGRRIK